jgi:hypothetical protein
MIRRVDRSSDGSTMLRDPLGTRAWIERIELARFGAA